LQWLTNQKKASQIFRRGSQTSSLSQGPKRSLQIKTFLKRKPRQCNFKDRQIPFVKGRPHVARFSIALNTDAALHWRHVQSLVTKGHAAIIELTRALRDKTGNLPPMPGVFPDYLAPIVRHAPHGSAG
jgi:hypothetical protein